VSGSIPAAEKEETTPMSDETSQNQDWTQELDWDVLWAHLDGVKEGHVLIVQQGPANTPVTFRTAPFEGLPAEWSEIVTDNDLVPKAFPLRTLLMVDASGKLVSGLELKCDVRRLTA
jgi:hypothetical protein